MIFLNLSPSLRFTPELVCETFVFNGGEPHVKIASTEISRDTTVTVTIQARTSQDFMLSVMACDALHRMGFRRVDLFIPYFPAARQDRVMVSGEPLSIKIFTAIVNSAGFDRVTVFDAHSEVTPALLNNCQAIPNHVFIREIIEAITPGKDLFIVAPDAGAAKKIHHLASAIGWERVLQCDKVRDVKTGQLSGAQVFADDLNGADCLIVDDICDGGGTFIQLAKALKAKNAGRLFLAISHGIFSKGMDELAAHFTTVFTTNSFYNGLETDFLKIIPLKVP